MLLVMCVALSACAALDSSGASQKRLDREVRANLAGWVDAGGVPVKVCSMPFEYSRPAMADDMAPQPYASIPDFSKSVSLVQAPIWECTLAGGIDAAPTAEQIDQMDWQGFGYVPVRAWHPITVVAYEKKTVTVNDYTSKFVPSSNYDGSVTCCWEQERTGSHEESVFSEHETQTYGTQYLAYPQIPKNNEQAMHMGARIYAIQGFRCAIYMRDFSAARQYWALFLRTAKVAMEAQVALQSLFLNEHLQIDGAAYLNIPQDIRSAVWDFDKYHDHIYTPYEVLFPVNLRFVSVSMEQVESAAQTGTLDKMLAGSVPALSVLYCPAFYPDFNPVSPEDNPKIQFKSDLLRHATESN
jgi:hypothetical protein